MGLATAWPERTLKRRAAVEETGNWTRHLLKILPVVGPHVLELAIGRFKEPNTRFLGSSWRVVFV